VIGQPPITVRLPTSSPTTRSPVPEKESL
jgi:hypothetical protein